MYKKVIYTTLILVVLVPQLGIREPSVPPSRNDLMVMVIYSSIFNPAAEIGLAYRF
jgi:hypothetical protein